MKANFWHERWEKNEIAFHVSDANPILVAHFSKLSLSKGSRIFVPLCGKSLDIQWLIKQGYSVVGAELSQKAIEQLFYELKIAPRITMEGKLKHYSAEHIDIFVGDIFDLTAAMLGRVDAIYDRAALVALPEPMREQYAQHLIAITGKAPQLLICYEYDQRLQEGPPFSVNDKEVARHYGAYYALKQLANVEIPGGLKGKCAATEKVWLITTRNL